MGSSLAVTVRASGSFGAATVAGLRVDYLDASKALMKTVFFRDARWQGAPVSWSNFEWPAATSSAVVMTSFCGVGCADGVGAPMTINLLANAPASWARDVVLGAVLGGSSGDATWSLDLP